MDLNQSPPPSSQKRMRRRKRDDGDGRTFVCQCGKAYLSYPALYTHIKTKHRGQKIPDPNQFNEEVQKRNTKSKQKPQQVQKQQEQDDKIILQNAVAYLSKKFPKDDLDIQSSQLAAQNKQLSTITQGHVSLKDMDKSHQDFIDRIISYWAHRTAKEELIDPSGTYTTSIDYVLGRFLLTLVPKVSSRATKFLIYFVIAFYEGVNKIKRSQSENYCTNNSAYNLPYTFNEMPLNHVPEFLAKEQFLNCTILVCKTLYYFGRWIYHQRYTNLDLRFNTFN